MSPVLRVLRRLLGGGIAVVTGGALLLGGAAVGTGIASALGGLGSSSEAPQPPAPTRAAFVGPVAGLVAASPRPPQIGPPTNSLDPADRLRPDGLGPVRVGMTAVEARVAAAQPLDSQGSGDCEQLVPASGQPPASFLVRAGRVVRIDVEHDSPVRTLSGFGIGTPVAAVHRHYGARIVQDQDQRLRLVGDDQRFSVVFEVEDGLVDAVRAGYADVVREGPCDSG